MLTKRFTELYTNTYGTAPSADFELDIEVMIEIGGALLHRAFLYERGGDERFIAKLRTLAQEYADKYVVPAS